jgi:hypothetical protein
VAPAVDLIFSLFLLFFTGNYQRLTAFRRKKARSLAAWQMKNSKISAGRDGQRRAQTLE